MGSYADLKMVIRSRSGSTEPAKLDLLLDLDGIHLESIVV
jgi:hypothetical protein